MGLAFYDSTKTLYAANPLRGVINGHVGGPHEELFYLRNGDVTKWFSNVVVSVTTSLYDGLGEFGTSGISFKFMYGERRPTEAEWSEVNSGDSLQIPNIGSTDLADTNTYHPIWVRIYVPGNTAANIYDNYAITVSYFSRVVGQ